jgi:peptidoglycan-associated lipoprotein
MKRSMSSWLVLVLVVVMAGCSSRGGTKGGVEVEDHSMGADAGTGTEGAVTSGAAAAGTYDMAALDDPNSPLARRVIYFDYDSAEISPADQDTLIAHAGFLVANPGAKVTLEGNTDERGSREYNIALGERRAESVKHILELNGVPSGQITVVSYGEEKPAAEGHSEAAWRLNRRVEIVYPQ